MDRIDDGPLPPAVAALARALSAALPGREAQERMLPEARRGQPVLPPRGASWRPAAVLALVHPGKEGGLALPLVVRSAHVGHHRGEVGLPGGSLDPGEEAVDAALRETGEELGLPELSVTRIRVLGALTPLRVPPSGFEIFPFVAWLGSRPDFRPEYPEIEEVIDLRLGELGLATPPPLAKRLMDGREGEVPYFPVAGRVVWGATAMILAELAAVLETAGLS